MKFHSLSQIFSQTDIFGRKFSLPNSLEKLGERKSEEYE